MKAFFRVSLLSILAFGFVQACGEEPEVSRAKERRARRQFQNQSGDVTQDGNDAGDTESAETPAPAVKKPVKKPVPVKPAAGDVGKTDEVKKPEDKKPEVNVPVVVPPVTTPEPTTGTVTPDPNAQPPVVVTPPAPVVPQPPVAKPDDDLTRKPNESTESWTQRVYDAARAYYQSATPSFWDYVSWLRGKLQDGWSFVMALNSWIWASGQPVPEDAASHPLD
jgi:hypothetical protein